MMRVVSKSQSRFHLDPRTALFLAITINIVTISAAPIGIFRYILPILWAVPAILLITYGLYRPALFYITLLISAYALQFITPFFDGFIMYLILGIISITFRIAPSIMMGRFLISTITISEFVNAMERLRFPKGFIISLSVMFRFFPTLIHDYRHIKNAMAFRGLSGTALLLHPIKAVEYRIMPLIISASKTGNDLTMASLTRGLSAPNTRTNLIQLQIRPIDVAWLFICFSIWGVFIWKVLS